jgi:hypothetical protein
MVLPGMSDGRCMTTYISSCNLNTNLMKTNNLNNNQYRKYLQENATKLMENTVNICKQSVTNECVYCIDLGNQK